MKQKKVAWLLALALTFTSIDGTAWAVKAEDFADDAVEENAEDAQELSGQEETASEEDGVELPTDIALDNEPAEELAVEEGTEEQKNTANPQEVQETASLFSDGDDFSDGEENGISAEDEEDDDTIVTVTKYRIITQPEIDSISLLDEETYIYAKGIKFSYTLPDGKKGTCSWDENAEAYMQPRLEFKKKGIKTPGTYKASIIFMADDADGIETQYRIRNAVSIKVESIEDYFLKHATRVTDTDIQTDLEWGQRNCYIYTVPEDGYYEVNADPETDSAQYAEVNVYNDSNENVMHIYRKAGENLCFTVKNTYDDGSDTFKVSIVRKDYALKSVKTLEYPEKLHLIGCLDCDPELSSEDIMAESTGLMVEAEYTDGEKEVLTPYDTSRDGQNIWMVEISRDTDENGNLQRIEYCVGFEDISDPKYFSVTYQSIGDYIKSQDRKPIDVIESGKKKVLQEGGYAGKIFQFTPEKTDEYVWQSFNQEDGYVYGYILNSNGEIIKKCYDGEDYNFEGTCKLEKGQIYYLIAYQDSGWSGKEYAQISPVKKVSKITLNTKSANVGVGCSLQLKTSIYPNDATINP